MTGDATCIAYWDEITTLTAPFTTTGKLGDAGVPGETVFTLEIMFMGEVDEDMYQDKMCIRDRYEGGGPNKAIQIGASHIAGGQASNMYVGTYMQSRASAGVYNIDPIKWRVLSNADGKRFLLSNQNLDVLPYNGNQTSVTWENCTLRSWLNGTFLKSALSDDEQGAIDNTYVYKATQ